MSGKELMIWWNNAFPKDHDYRQKYKIAFGSSEHLLINQIDVYLEALETRLYTSYIESYQEEQNGLETYKKTGNWLKERELDEKRFSELFDAVDVESFNKKKE